MSKKKLLKVDRKDVYEEDCGAREPLLIAVREEVDCPFRDVRDGFCCLELCDCMTLKSKDCPLKNSDHVYVRLVDTIARS